MIGYTPTEVIERQALLEELAVIETTRKEWIVEAVLERNRFDVLAREVLGLEVMPFHRALQKFALRHPHSLQLAFRGSGKTTTVTVVLCIGMILLNPNVRILIASRTHALAKKILSEIKWHFENNKVLIELFGDHIGKKWDTFEITVAGRSIAAKEATITTIGTEGQVVGGHYDVIFGDDLVDETNAVTPGQRAHVKTWFYKTLLPCLEPEGELHIIGTRYHFDDLYGHLEVHDMRDSTQVIPALDEKGRSPWPSKFSVSFLKELRVNAGTIIFDCQYQCDTKKMRGGVFQYDWMIECELSEVPEEVQIYHGADLAIGKKSQNDYFAMVAIAVQGRRIWILDSFEQRLTFSQQAKTIADWHDRDDPIETGIEANAYQAALADEVAEKYPRVRPKKVFTKKNKDVRSLKLAVRFEADEVRFVKGNRRLIDHLVLYPKGSHDDLFDALDHAVSRAFKSRRRNRRKRARKLGVL